MRPFVAVLAWSACAGLGLPAAAQLPSSGAPVAREHGPGREPQPPGPAQAATPVVETRATLVSITEEQGRIFVHLKIVPRARLPFTTHRFRVRDRAQLAGLQAGDSVKFRAERVEGENTLLAIRGVPACVRFQSCP